MLPLFIVGESGLIYLLIPLVYFWVFVFAVLLAIILAIFRKTRFLSSPLVVGALISIVGLIFSILELQFVTQWAATLPQKFTPGTTLARWLDFVWWTSPFMAALSCLIASYGAPLYFALRRRRERQIAEHSRSSPRDAARSFGEGALL